MRIIGVSGIEGTIEFKRRHWPDLEEREYRISQGHDSAAALVVDGELRSPSPRSESAGASTPASSRPARSSVCLAEAGLEAGDIDEIAHAFDYAPYRAMYALDPISSELYRDVLCREAFASHACSTRCRSFRQIASSTSSIISRMPPRPISPPAGMSASWP